MQKKSREILDSGSESDEDYVPPDEKKATAKTEEEQCGRIVDEDQLTGIDAIKSKKRNREIDDLFDLMNAEDPIKKAMN